MLSLRAYRRLPAVVLTAILLWGHGLSFAQVHCPVIPLPARATAVPQVFTLTAHTPVVVKAPALGPAVRLWQQWLLRYTGVAVNQGAAGSGLPSGGVIIIEQTKASQHGDALAGEAYTLTMSAKQVTVRAASEAGILYGLMSLLQLARLAPAVDGSLRVACWNVVDQPVFGWRGLMLDESRHFFGMEVVKTLLDQMALYKLNRFHWHLTDEPGWRIAIQRFPFLTSIGGKGTFTDSVAPAAYYSQAQIADVIAYAAARHITVVPEIDMPGHASAANRAYPAFSGGGSVKHPDFTFHPGKETTYTFLTHILQEVNTLFPAGMIHIGGDEVSFGNDQWAKDPEVLALMRAHHLSSVAQVEHYFIKRIADSLRRLHTELLVWDEAVEANLDPRHTIAFWWRQEKPQQLTMALNKGYRVVLCPRLPFYFDFVQDSSHRKGRRWNGAFNAPENIYRFSPAALPIPAGKLPQVLGVQANVWTETVVTTDRLQYLLFPRLLALAETAWTPPALKDFGSFEKRLPTHLTWLLQDSIRYFDPLQPVHTPEIIR